MAEMISQRLARCPRSDKQDADRAHGSDDDPRGEQQNPELRGHVNTRIRVPKKNSPNLVDPKAKNRNESADHRRESDASDDRYGPPDSGGPSEPSG